MKTGPTEARVTGSPISQLSDNLELTSDPARSHWEILLI